MAKRSILYCGICARRRQMGFNVPTCKNCNIEETTVYDLDDYDWDQDSVLDD